VVKPTDLAERERALRILRDAMPPEAVPKVLRDALLQRVKADASLLPFQPAGWKPPEDVVQIPTQPPEWRRAARSKSEYRPPHLRRLEVSADPLPAQIKRLTETLDAQREHDHDMRNALDQLVRVAASSEARALAAEARQRRARWRTGLLATLAAAAAIVGILSGVGVL
jgi:hypothetical protein